jgi:outer membrane receptor protein involved in Fe transport
MRAQSSRPFVVFAVTLALGLAGCASGGGTGSRPAGSTANRIVRAELAGIDQIDALQAVNRLRPSWVSMRGGSEPVLYVDGVRRANFRDLSTMQTTDIEQIEYMSGSDASTRYGTGHGGGAIMVTTRR